MKRQASVSSNSSQGSDEGDNAFTKEKVEAAGRTYMVTPKKTMYRMHAHINPFNPLSMSYPRSPDFVDWSLSYPSQFNLPDRPKNNGDKIMINTKKHPVEGDYK